MQIQCMSESDRNEGGKGSHMVCFVEKLKFIRIKDVLKDLVLAPCKHS